MTDEEIIDFAIYLSIISNDVILILLYPQIFNLLDDPYHLGLSCYYINEFCSLVFEETKLVVFLMGTGTRESKRTFKTPSFRL